RQSHKFTMMESKTLFY
ncbi:calcineurin-like phosphoesterase family protein, partial [Vibrio parahaemolyticus V-223/04]